jgi:hypothetical protein
MRRGACKPESLCGREPREVESARDADTHWNDLESVRPEVENHGRLRLGFVFGAPEPVCRELTIATAPHPALVLVKHEEGPAHDKPHLSPTSSDAFRTRNRHPPREVNTPWLGSGSSAVALA